ncbi:Tetratricopeptide repeat-containing protein [Hymenobacter gelipurpurascens]|uniref:Tetratricopeptide repeat-containing protein n=1 Tax=Hymenobacter gelipurpurascens TaxID=89968 RepID=A0A212UCB3_9BACT|nr:tetratricopeptide repeat protein [Hymenobacter gelipurpurascens]SNC75877.1 Tetratricopeptide repeat-containing protein [Hymenobacter gelipurpurascens]
MSRKGAFILLLLGLSVAELGHAQQPAQVLGKSAVKTEKPPKAKKLSRKERKALSRRAELEAMQLQKRPLSEKDQEMSEAFFVDGLRYLMLEDYNKALERLLKAYALSPANAAINYKIAETNLLSGNLSDATNFAQSAVKLDPKNAYYYLLLAQIYTSQKQYDQAAKVYTTLIKDVPDSGNYLFNLADLYMAQGKLNEALSTFEQAEKKFGTIDEVSFKKQQIYLKQNNLDKALQEGEVLIASNPEEVRYVLAQAQMYAANNRFPDAIRVAQQALKQDPENPQARMILADVYRQQNNPQESQKQIKLAFENPGLDIDNKVRILIDYIKQLPNPALNQSALELAEATTRTHPKEAKAFSIAGDIQTITDHKKDARASYLKAIELDNTKFQIWQQVVLIDAELNDVEGMLQHTNKALELFPNQASLWFYNGVAYMLQKQPAKGIKSLEYGRKLATDNPELLAQFDTQLGDAYHEVKEYAKSDAAYEAALVFDANNAQALNNYSYYLSLRGEKLAKAKEMAGKLVKQNPDNDTYLDTYGWVLYKMKDYAGARQQFELALKTTKDATVIEHYGDVLYQLGERDKALAEWQRAQKQGGASALIDRKIKDKKLYE